MAGRRVPLGNLPNAANSPFREVTALGSKRPRAYAADQRDLSYAQQPPAKKQHIEIEDVENRRAAIQRKGGPTSSLRRGAAAKATSEKASKATQENLNDIRQWQRHYKKLFPQMTFYYDNVPDDVRHKISRQIALLGSREEVFFSKAVTHVVTTRAIPSNDAGSSSSLGRSPPKSSRYSEVQNGTVNPVHLKKAVAPTFHPNDILVRARDMGIKTWTLEKLQRMLTTLFNSETGEAPVQPYHGRATSVAPTKTAQTTHLSQMLAKEKEYGHINMEWTMDMAPFRGYYIYVHDMDELTKAVIVRDYSKPATKEQGKWPQLRVTSAGRCPFLDDPSANRPAPEKAARVTRAAAAREKTPAERGALTENNNVACRQRAASAQAEDTFKPMDPPKPVPIKRGSTDNLPLFGSAQASLRRHPRFAGGEPVASGVQPSNVTSAIRSQMISSTAAAPGGKAAASKELNRLQRQVLERSNLTNPYLNNDLRAAINDGSRPSQKRKLQHIKEEDVSEEEQQLKRTAAPRKKKIVEKELKPGYCENCRVKFGDFDEHVVSRQHRKFATTDDNWTELDALLDVLVRPEKDE